MPIHTNPFKLYKGRICMSHGLLVGILRSTQRFWVAYKDLMELNGKRQSDQKDLALIMKKMDLEPKKKRRLFKLTPRKLKKKVQALRSEFKASIDDLEGMSSSLKDMMRDDETLLYRFFLEVRRLYKSIKASSKLPDSISAPMLHHVHAILFKMCKIQRHTWTVSKAHARDSFKIEDMSILTEWVHRRRIRTETLELDQLNNRIRPIADKLKHMKSCDTPEMQNDIHDEISELLHLYHQELEDLHHIIHETDILIRRTELMLRSVEREAAGLKLEGIEKMVHDYTKSFKKLLKSIESQARRENNDMWSAFNMLPAPPKSA